MEKINIAELLKDCPKGMELDCPIWDNVIFDHIDMSDSYPILIKIKGEGYEKLTEYGQFNHYYNAKCVIFPKGKTTWDGFQRPFMDGDIVLTMESINYKSWISIFKNNNKNGIITYADVCVESNLFYQNSPTILCDNYDVITQRLATEEEKQKLFDAIKENGYKWNAETKTLEKLEQKKFDIITCLTKHDKKELINFAEAEKEKADFVGDGFIECFANFLDFKEGKTYWLEYIGDDKYNVRSDNLLGKTYHITPGQLYTIFKKLTWLEKQDIFSKKSEKPQGKSALEAINEEKVDNANKTEPKDYSSIDPHFGKPIDKAEPKFKVGDKIKHKSSNLQCTIGEYSKGISAYRTNIGLSLTPKDLEQWELAPNKFDITTMKPFDKVLVKTKVHHPVWSIDFYGGYDVKRGGSFTPFAVTGDKYFQQCIPYEGNEHLLGTTNDCSEYYKTWEE